MQRQKQRLQRRLRKQQRDEERNQRRARLMRKNRKSCSGHSMKCFSHDDDHWKTPPYWTCKLLDGGNLSTHIISSFSDTVELHSLAGI